MNSTKKITIKWNKELYQLDVSFSTASELKQEISKKTLVEPNRQKLLFKGKVLNDNYELVNLPGACTLTMMGNPSVNTSNSSNKILFVEDLSSEDKAKIARERGEEVVYGLQNLGNTCYLNSVLQCLGRVPELRTALENTNIDNNNDMKAILVKELGNTYKALDTAHDTVVPYKLVQVLRTLNPLFGEADQGGNFKQQDAEECWSLLLNNIRDYLPNKNKTFSSYLSEELFGIELDVQMKNVEEPSEIKKSKEIIYKLPCFIDSTTTELTGGLKASMKENVELNSELLNRNTFFEKSQVLNRLPPYLTVQFMRFFWKQANVSTGAKAGKAKILKSVIFSKIVDLYDMCSDSTKEILNIGRNIETKMLKEDKNFRIENVINDGSKEMVPTGRYQLISMVTHQGRSSESGHYIGYAHKKDDKWTKYDDDTITTVNVTDILELKGGGDWPMGYMCIFKRLEVPFSE